MFRGSVANGLRFAGLTMAATGAYDWMKENTYYFFGPISMVRFVATTAGVTTAFLLSMPFDAIRTRLHTMRPLPNGQYPYTGFADCMGKIL